MAGSRHNARTYALQVLYAADVSEAEGPVMSRLLGEVSEVELDESGKTFASSLVAAASESREAIDGDIQGASRNWRIERMSRVDRNILRLATAELRLGGEVPARVVINEAVELAKTFGTAESPAFVNGILDRIASAVAGTGEAQ